MGCIELWKYHFSGSVKNGLEIKTNETETSNEANIVIQKRQHESLNLDSGSEKGYKEKINQIGLEDDYI